MAYVPPHARGGAKKADEGEAPPSRGKGGGKGYDNGGGTELRREGSEENRERKGGGGKGGGRNFSFGTDNGGGLDWRKRQDGRREGQNEKTELETFGPKKEQSTAGIDFDKYDAIPVQITGDKTEELTSISRFSEAKLTDSLFDNLRRCGYERPTPVQKHAIPIVIAGRDVMACAQTGSGKTCAFMVPCLESLLRSGPPGAGGRGGRPKPSPCALVLAPTRELASQIHVESCKFSFETGIKACIVYGGADMREQRNELEKGCDVLIATPGRLTDMCDRGNVSLELIQFFILDEADRMLDMGFEPQVRQIVEQTGMSSRSKARRQSMMFSATFAREVQAMALDFLTEYIFITVGRVGSASELVTQTVMYAGDVKQKASALTQLLKNNLPPGGLAIVFVETKRAADTLELDLHAAGTSVTAIHGDRTQTEREEALHAFKTGQCPVMVATDVAARGLDIPNVALVVNFDMPKQIDDYVHRIGRTGRAGRKGTAVGFVNERCTYLPELRDLLNNAKQDLPHWFDELIGARGSAGRKGGGRDNAKFGGQDLRATDEKFGGGKSAAPAAAKTAMAAPKGDGYGNTGAEDAW